MRQDVTGKGVVVEDSCSPPDGQEGERDGLRGDAAPGQPQGPPAPARPRPAAPTQAAVLTRLDGQITALGPATSPWTLAQELWGHLAPRPQHTEVVSSELGPSTAEQRGTSACVGTRVVSALEEGEDSPACHSGDAS